MKEIYIDKKVKNEIDRLWFYYRILDKDVSEDEKQKVIERIEKIIVRNVEYSFWFLRFIKDVNPNTINDNLKKK